MMISRASAMTVKERLVNAAITARKAMDEHPGITVHLDIHEHWVTIWVRKDRVLTLSKCVPWDVIELSVLDDLPEMIGVMVDRINREVTVP